MSYTPTFHVSWLRPLGTGVLYCYPSSKWSLAQSPFSCSTLYLSWRVGNLHIDTLSGISVEHDIQKYFCRTSRQHSPLSDLLADSKMLRLSQWGWALGREASHQHQSDGPPKSLLWLSGPFWTSGAAQRYNIDFEGHGDEYGYNDANAYAIAPGSFGGFIPKFGPCVFQVVSKGAQWVKSNTACSQKVCLADTRKF